MKGRESDRGGGRGGMGWDQQVLPAEFDVLCTHPMFGPESGKGSWEGLPVVYDKVRISSGQRARCADRMLGMFASEVRDGARGTGHGGEARRAEQGGQRGREGRGN